MLSCSTTLRCSERLASSPRNEFLHIDVSAKRPDLLVCNFEGTRACFDVSVTHPALGEAADKREHAKFSKDKDIAKAAGMAFYPLVHEAHTHGFHGAQANQLKVCSRLVFRRLLTS